MMQKTTENDWNPGKWVLIWKCSARAIQWTPTWQGLDGFQKSLPSSALDEGSLSIGRVKSPNADLIKLIHQHAPVNLPLPNGRWICTADWTARTITKYLSTFTHPISGFPRWECGNLQTTTVNTSVQRCIYQITMWISTSILRQWM